MRQTVDGNRDIQAFWKEGELNDTSKIRILLEKDPLWEVFQLRAVVLMQGRVHAQIEYIRSIGNPRREESVRESESTNQPSPCSSNVMILQGRGTLPRDCAH